MPARDPGTVRGARRVAPLVLLVSLLGCLSIAGSDKASAVAPLQQGWWSITGPGIVPPDVPPDGLAVQGDAEDPAAVAALLANVPDGFVGVSLTLQIAPGSATVPGSSLRACPLTQHTFAPAQGGALDDAPSWDCSDFARGTAAADGLSYTLSVGPLVRNGLLAVALVGETLTDRLVLARPGVDAIEVTGSPVVGSPTEEPSIPPVPTSGASAGPPPLSTGVQRLPGVPFVPASVAPSVAPAQPSFAPASAATVVRPSWGSEDSSPGLAVAALLVALVAVLGAAQRYRVLHAAAPVH